MTSSRKIKSGYLLDTESDRDGSALRWRAHQGFSSRKGTGKHIADFVYSARATTMHRSQRSPRDEQ